MFRRNNQTLRSKTKREIAAARAAISAAERNLKDAPKKKGPGPRRATNNNRPGKGIRPKGPRTGRNGPRGTNPQYHVHSILHNIKVPTVSFDGDAHQITDIVRMPYTVETANLTDRCIFAISMNGFSSQVAWQAIWTPGSSLPPVFKGGDLPQLKNTWDRGGPTSGRAMKVGASLICHTPLLNRGSGIYVLNCTQRVAFKSTASAPPWWTAADLDDLYTKLVAYNQTVPYDATEFRQAKSWSCFPVNSRALEEFHQWQGEGDPLGDTITDSIFTSTVGSGLGTEYNRPLSTLFFIFDKVPEPNSFSVTVKGSAYVRYPMDVPMGQNMPPIPTAPPAQINHHRHAAEAWANNPVVGAVGAALTAGASGAASALWANRGTLGRAFARGGAYGEAGAGAAGIELPALGGGAMATAEELALLGVFL